MPGRVDLAGCYYRPQPDRLNRDAVMTAALTAPGALNRIMGARLEPLGDIPPEHEAQYYHDHAASTVVGVK